MRSLFTLGAFTYGMLAYNECSVIETLLSQEARESYRSLLSRLMSQRRMRAAKPSWRELTPRTGNASQNNSSKGSNCSGPVHTPMIFLSLFAPPGSKQAHRCRLLTHLSTSRSGRKGNRPSVYTRPHYIMRESGCLTPLAQSECGSAAKIVSSTRPLGSSHGQRSLVQESALHSDRVMQRLS